MILKKISPYIVRCVCAVNLRAAVMEHSVTCVTETGTIADTVFCTAADLLAGQRQTVH
jgi:hypothetical protein